MEICLKRVYEPNSSEDGRRILVDRVWPRGISKDGLNAERWMPEVAPSTGLRRWFAHDPERWEEFKARYFTELDANPEPVGQLLELVRASRVTLLYSAKDQVHNQAAALRDYLLRLS